MKNALNKALRRKKQLCTGSTLWYTEHDKWQTLFIIDKISLMYPFTSVEEQLILISLLNYDMKIWSWGTAHFVLRITSL